MFDDCHSVEQVERRKRTLSAELHPDAGGDHERFLAMTAAYERARARVLGFDIPEPPPVAPQPEKPHPAPPQAPTQGPDDLLSMINTGIRYFGQIADIVDQAVDHYTKLKAAKKKAAKVTKTKAATKAKPKKKATGSMPGGDQ